MVWDVGFKGLGFLGLGLRGKDLHKFGRHCLEPCSIH